MNPVQMFYRAIIRRSWVTLFLLFMGLQFSSIAQTSTTYNISGYCDSIEIVGSITTYSDQIIDVAVQSTQAYLSASSLGLRIVDISTPNQPVEIGHYQTPEDNQQVIINGNYAYLAEDTIFRIVDISDPTNIKEIGNFTTGYYIYDMAINNGFAFFNHGAYPLEILDIHSFSNITDVLLTDNYYEAGLAVESTFMYLVVNGNLDVFDISSISNIKEIGSCSVGGYGNSIFLGKKYVYVVSIYSVVIVDRSNPYQPIQVGNYANGDNQSVTENGDFMYIGDNVGVEVVNINDPSNPIEVAYYDTPAGVPSLAFQNNYLYTADQYSGFYVFNLDNPLGNVSVNLTGDTTLTTMTDSTGYYEIDGLTYGNYTVTPSVVDYQFYPIQQVYSGLTSDQTNQDYSGTFNINVTINSIPSGLLVYAYTIATTAPFSISIGGHASFTIGVTSPTISIDSLTQFAFTSWSDSGAQSHTVYPTTSTTYTVSYDTQYFLTAVPSPNNSGEINPFDCWIPQNSLVSCTAVPNNGFQFVDWMGDLNWNNNPQDLLMNGPKTIGANFSLISSGNLRVDGYCVRPDLSGNYYEVGHILSENTTYSLTINGTLAFLADGTAGLRIIDISNPSNPISLSGYTTTNFIEGVDVRGNYAYVVAGYAGLHILDISNPSHPIEVGSYDTSGYYAFRVAIQGNYAYVAYDRDGLWIIDISNPANPIGIMNIIPNNFGVLSGELLRVAVSGDYAYTIDWVTYSDEILTWNYNNFRIVDIRNPFNPQVVGTYTYGGNGDLSLIGVAVQGNYAYLLNDDGELIILDISQPTNPVEISGTNIPGNPHGIDVRGDFAYIASWGSGLQVVNITNPYSPYVVGSYQTPGLARDLKVDGSYVYDADDTSGLRIIHVAYPIPNTAMTLSGNTNQFTYTDSSGYYEFDNLPFGNYTVVPYNNLFGSFSPSTNTYTGLDYNQLNENYVGTYSAWANTNGEFANAEDTENWAFQPAPNVSNQPTITWVPTYQGNTGVLQLTFSSQTQGIKMTSFTRFTPDTTNPWYRLRVTYYSDSIFNGYIIPVILTYHDNLSEVIQELGASFTGDSLIQPGTWYTLDAYLCCHDTSGQIQIIVDNNGSAANVYIDSIDLENVPPPGFTNSTYVTLPWGGFEMSTETSYWGLEPAPGAPNGQPTLGWESSAMSYSFTTSSQGQKMTSRNTFYIPVNSNAVMSFNVLSDSPTPTGLSVIGYLFAEKDVKNYIWDVAGVGNIGILSADTWNTIYVPLTSVSEQTSYRLQLLIRNTDQYPENVYLDDIELFYGSTLSNNQTELVLASTPKELMN